MATKSLCVIWELGYVFVHGYTVAELCPLCLSVFLFRCSDQFWYESFQFWGNRSRQWRLWWCRKSAYFVISFTTSSNIILVLHWNNFSYVFLFLLSLSITFAHFYPLPFSFSTSRPLHTCLATSSSLHHVFRWSIISNNSWRFSNNSAKQHGLVCSASQGAGTVREVCRAELTFTTNSKPNELSSTLHNNALTPDVDVVWNVNITSDFVHILYEYPLKSKDDVLSQLSGNFQIRFYAWDMC